MNNYIANNNNNNINDNYNNGIEMASNNKIKTGEERCAPLWALSLVVLL